MDEKNVYLRASVGHASILTPPATANGTKKRPRDNTDAILGWQRVFRKKPIFELLYQESPKLPEQKESKKGDHSDCVIRPYSFAKNRVLLEYKTRTAVEIFEALHKIGDFKNLLEIIHEYAYEVGNEQKEFFGIQEESKDIGLAIALKKNEIFKFQTEPGVIREQAVSIKALENEITNEHSELFLRQKKMKTAVILVFCYIVCISYIAQIGTGLD